MDTETRPIAPGTDHRWLALAVIAVAQLMVALDATIVNIALPTAQRMLGFSDADRALVVTAYTTPLAGLLLLGGRVADRLGRRTAFLAGLVGFAVASAVAGAAPTFALLVAGRALQGVFAALLVPTALSLVAVTFTEPRDRGKAFGVYGAVASSGAAVGLMLGGALTEYVDWRWCLYVNVMIAALAFAAALLVVPRTPGHHDARIDLASGVLGTIGIGAVVAGCAQAAEHGWSSYAVLAPVCGGLLALVAFLLRQARTEHPLLPLWVLADRRRGGAYLAVAAGVLASFGMFLMLTYQFQVVLGYGPLRTGLAFLPLSAVVSASSYGLGSRLLPVVPARSLIVPGLLLSAASLLLLALVGPDAGYLRCVLPAELLLGLGMGLAMTPAMNVATSGVEPRYAGVAAATATTSMQLGASIGTAVPNSLAVGATAAYARTRADTALTAALVHGTQVATGWAAAMLVVTAAATAFALSSSRERSSS
jgi:EmrB/QacA subfamily drug resistance transporter